MNMMQQIFCDVEREKLKFFILDLNSLKNIQNFAKEINNMKIAIDILIICSGIYAPKTIEFSENKIEKTFAINHVGPFYLMMGLLFSIETAALRNSARIVFVTSPHYHRHPSDGIGFGKLNDEKEYNQWKWYGQTKLANILTMMEVVKRLKIKGINNVFANSVFPGFVKSHHMENANMLAKAVSGFSQVLVERASLNVIYVATSPDIEINNLKGKYFTGTGNVTKVESIMTEKLAEECWNYTERMIKDKLGKNYLDFK